MTNEKDLESQIGHLGGEEPAAAPETSSVGKKLKHIPGAKEKLDADENKDMEAFLNRANSRSKVHYKADESNDEAPQTFIRISEGWNEINRAELGERSQFYPEDWRFYVRPATVEAVKNWSSIDEERIDVVNAVFNDIMRTCVSIKSDSGNIPWNRINSWDRFWFILKVREYTFKTGESKIEFTDTCPECGEEISYTLTSNALFYEFPDEDIVEKHWNAVDRLWYIDPKQYDLDRAAVKLYIPTLEKDQAILDWGIAQARANRKLDNVFFRFLPWLLPKVPKDPEVLSKFIQEAQMKYKSWDVEMFEFMDDVVRNITINPSEKLKQVCPHCGEEVVSNVRFPNGVKTLFRQPSKHSKFGSR